MKCAVHEGRTMFSFAIYKPDGQRVLASPVVKRTRIILCARKAPLDKRLFSRGFDAFNRLVFKLIKL